jgi:hypothetical protein
VPKHQPLFGLTGYEQREEAGEPHCWQEDDGVLAVEEPLPVCPQYLVTARFHIGSSGPQLIGLDFGWTTFLLWPPPMLTTVMYRAAPIDILYKKARAWLSISVPVGLDFDVELKEFKLHPRPGRQGRSDTFYAGVAAQYVEISGSSSTPTKDLAEKLHLSASRTRDLLHQARQRKLLTKTTRGLAGGQLTEKAKGLLDETR